MGKGVAFGEGAFFLALNDCGGSLELLFVSEADDNGAQTLLSAVRAGMLAIRLNGK